MEQYLTLKRKKILTYAARWMNPEETMPSEINQSQKDKHYVIPFNEFPRGVKFTESGGEGWWPSR